MNIVKVAPKPEEMIVKVKEGRKNIDEAFISLINGLAQTQSAVMALSGWQESFLEEFLPLINTDFTFRKNAETYKRYGQVSSLQEAVEKLPVSRGSKNEITQKINQKVQDWAAANKDIAYLSARMRSILVKNLMAKFQCESLDRMPCCIVPEVLEWLDSYRFPDLLNFGPLSAVLAYTRAARGMSMADAAAQLGVKKSTYAGWEGAGRVPHERNQPAIARFTGRDDVAELVKMQRLHLMGRPAIVQEKKVRQDAQ